MTDSLDVDKTVYSDFINVDFWFSGDSILTTNVILVWKIQETILEYLVHRRNNYLMCKSASATKQKNENNERKLFTMTVVRIWEMYTNMEKEEKYINAYLVKVMLDREALNEMLKRGFERRC